MIITEIVKMKTTEGLEKQEFIRIVDSLEENFHKIQKGFIDSELLYYEEENTWYILQHWQSKEDLKEASRKIFTDKSAEEFIKVIDPKNVKMLVMPQINTWK